MKILILAAGIGSRMKDETKDKPKAMIRVNNKPLIQYQIESVLEAGFDYSDIYVLGGYKMEKIQEHYENTDINFIYNEHYRAMNNIYSFLLSQKIEDDILLINSDDFYDKRMIKRLIESEPKTAILVDKVKVLTEEAMRVTLENNKLRLINKKIELDVADGEYIGISKLNIEDLKVLYKKAEEMIDAGDINAWYENVYEACSEVVDIIAVDTNGYPWVEIDDLNDLNTAKELAITLNLE